MNCAKRRQRVWGRSRSSPDRVSTFPISLFWLRKWDRRIDCREGVIKSGSGGNVTTKRWNAYSIYDDGETASSFFFFYSIAHGFPPGLRASRHFRSRRSKMDIDSEARWNRLLSPYVTYLLWFDGHFYRARRQNHFAVALPRNSWRGRL